MSDSDSDHCPMFTDSEPDIYISDNSAPAPTPLKPLSFSEFEKTGRGGSITAYADYCIDWAKEQRQKATAKEYRYLLTFTIDPKKKPDTAKAKDWIVRNVVNPLHKPNEVYYSEELTQKGQVHWHVVGSYGKSLKKSLFKYYQSKYGRIDFSRTSQGEGLKNGLAYLQKEEEPIKLL